MSDTNVQTLTCNLCGSTRHTPFANKHNLNYVRCEDCGFVFTDIRGFDYASYNEHAMDEQRDVHMSKHTSPRYIKTYNKLLKEFEPYRKTNRFLEIGSSTGGFLKQVNAHGWEEYGVEPESASAQYAKNELGLNVHEGTLDTADYEPESFDVIYSNAVIEHLADPSLVLQQAHQLLRPGGLIYADTVNLDCYTWKFIGTDWKLFDPRMHLCLYTPQTLRQHFEQTGFQVLKMNTHGVRFHATRAQQPKGFKRLTDELKKAPYSFAARRNLRGDNICVYGVK